MIVYKTGRGSKGFGGAQRGSQSSSTLKSKIPSPRELLSPDSQSGRRIWVSPYLCHRPSRAWRRWRWRRRKRCYPSSRTCNHLQNGGGWVHLQDKLHPTPPEQPFCRTSKMQQQGVLGTEEGLYPEEKSWKFVCRESRSDAQDP